jgi:putative phosphoribosyl transferase
LEQVENSKQKLKDYSKKFKTRNMNLEAKIVILVDDGIATGSSVNAAIKYLRLKKVKKIILASPVAPVDTAHELRSKVDEAVILDEPANFQSVGQFYKNFPEVPDAEVVQLLQKTK